MLALDFRGAQQFTQVVAVRRDILNGKARCLIGISEGSWHVVGSQRSPCARRRWPVRHRGAVPPGAAVLPPGASRADRAAASEERALAGSAVIPGEAVARAREEQVRGASGLVGGARAAVLATAPMGARRAAVVQVVSAPAVAVQLVPERGRAVEDPAAPAWVEADVAVAGPRAAEAPAWAERRREVTAVQARGRVEVPVAPALGSVLRMTPDVRAASGVAVIVVGGASPATTPRIPRAASAPADRVVRGRRAARVSRVRREGVVIFAAIHSC